VERKLVDIHSLIEDTVSLLKRAGAKNVKIETSLDAEKNQISGHVSSLQNVFMNLGVNACHAMPHGGRLEIRTSNRTLDEFTQDATGALLAKGEYIEIVFRDFGVGIPEEIKSKIFEPFFTTKEEGKGTGLGLALAYSMVQDHDGAITVDSTEGKGSSFKILLPLASSDAEDATGDSSPGGDPQKEKGKTVLYVDDEELIRISTKLRLEEMGYRVLLADNADTAIEIFKKMKDEIDLILSDMVMPPGMDGEELFLTLKNINPDLRFAIYSGFFNGYHAKSMMANGLAGFIMKPATEEELRSFMEKMLRRP
jgi:CheY-like chemotaxis protein/two-component sensor histidine kinase